MFDVVIVSNGKNPKFRKITQKAADSCGENCIIVEQDKGMVYKNYTTLHYDFEFNYNKCLNYGASKGSSDYIVFCNNDLIFYEGWQQGMITGFLMGYGSLSPYCPRHHRNIYDKGEHIYEGYGVRYELAGWCIVCKRSVWEQIGGFDEDVTFWYSDNLYADQLQYHGIRHGLVCNSFVEHLESTTLKTVKHQELTIGQQGRYNEARKKYAKGESSIS